MVVVTRYWERTPVYPGNRHVAVCDCRKESSSGIAIYLAHENFHHICQLWQKLSQATHRTTRPPTTTNLHFLTSESITRERERQGKWQQSSQPHRPSRGSAAPRSQPPREQASLQVHTQLFSYKIPILLTFSECKFVDQTNLFLQSSDKSKWSHCYTYIYVTLLIYVLFNMPSIVVFYFLFSFKVHFNYEMMCRIFSYHTS